jgi:Meckel syndrome type 1 protein
MLTLPLKFLFQISLEMAELAFIQKEIELRQNLAGNKFITPLPMGGKVYILGELTSAKDFDEDNIYIFLETRLPEGWDYNTEDYDDPRITDSDLSDLTNRPRNITQISKASPQGYNRKPVNYFSFPLSWALAASSAALVSEWPKVLVQVNSCDAWGRHKILGYGFLQFPPSPGFYQLSVHTCRPVENLYAEVHGFYLGGAVRVENPWELTDSTVMNEEGEKAPVNRYGFRTQSAGQVNFQLSVVVQTNAELLKQVEIAEGVNRRQKKELKWKREQRKTQQIINREQERRVGNR